MQVYSAKGSAAEIYGNFLVVPPNSLAQLLFIHGNEGVEKKIEIGANSLLRMYSIYSKNAKIKNSFLLSGNSSLEIFDIFFGNVSATNSILLENANCALHLLAKGTLGENESASYSALAAIGENAANANVDLEEHAYLLGTGAKASLVPGLEISNNDVSARHASSIREIDGEQVFYLMSRGLSESEARKGIVSGFFSREVGEIRRLFNYEVKI